jgi:hypothetical protein
MTTITTRALLAAAGLGLAALTIAAPAGASDDPAASPPDAQMNRAEGAGSGDARSVTASTVTCTFTPTPPKIKTILLIDKLTENPAGGAPDATRLKDVLGDDFTVGTGLVKAPASDGQSASTVTAPPATQPSGDNVDAAVATAIKAAKVGLDIKPSGEAYVLLYPSGLRSAANRQAGRDEAFLVEPADNVAGPDLRQRFIDKFTTQLPDDAAITIAPDDAESADARRVWSVSSPGIELGSNQTFANSHAELQVFVIGGASKEPCGTSSDLPATLTITGAPADASIVLSRNGVPVQAIPYQATTPPPGPGPDDPAPNTPSTPSGSTAKGSSSSTALLAGVGGLIVGAGAIALLRRRSAGDPTPAPVAGYGGGYDGGVPAGFGPGGGPTTGPGTPGRRPAAPVDGGGHGAIPAGTPGRGLRVQPAPPGWTGSTLADRSIRLGELGLNRLLPRDGAVGRTWAYEARGTVAMAGWYEKKTGRGEDAEPTLRIHADGRALLGAYDGTGGAGASIARRLRDGTELTGAFVSARLVRDIVETWGLRRLDQGPIGDPADLTDALTGALRDEATTVPDAGGVRGSLSKKLPTTAALLAVTPVADGTVRAEAIWAGDSRGFALTPSLGLQVLTVDDTRETDALALIRNDQPMTNVISADKAFQLNSRAIERHGPALFLVATDGCFGYVSTPAHFEYLLLDALMNSTSIAAWADRIVVELAEFAADDISFAAVSTGFDDFASLQRAFGPRHRLLDEQHWQPFVATPDPADRERLREESWQHYRGGYEELISANGRR